MKRRILLFAACIFLIAISIFLPEDVYANAVCKQKEVTLEVGKTKNLRVAGSVKKIQWSSSNASVVKVSPKGEITAVAKGSAIISAKAGKKKYICKVFVYDIDYKDARVVKEVRKIIQKKIQAGMSTTEKIQAIHDYLILNCAYDVESIQAGTIPWGSYRPEGVLLKKKAVCQGYAEAFLLFMDSLNIPCKLVTGTAGGDSHAWNVVKVDGKWYQIDVTWDDPVPDKKGQIRYNYFLIPDRVMDNDHKWKKSNYPKCTASSDKFIDLIGKVSVNKDQAIESLYNQYSAGKNELTLIYTKKYWKSLKSNKIPYFEMREKYGVNTIRHNSYKYTCYEYGKYIILKIFI